MRHPVSLDYHRRKNNTLHITMMKYLLYRHHVSAVARDRQTPLNYIIFFFQLANTFALIAEQMNLSRNKWKQI